jgi:hypothetical protein
MHINLCPISYSYERTYNAFGEQKALQSHTSWLTYHADRLADAGNSNTPCPNAVFLTCSSNAARFSRTHLTTSAFASCPTASFHSHLAAFSRWADRSKLANSRSCSDISEHEHRYSKGGNVGSCMELGPFPSLICGTPFLSYGNEPSQAPPRLRSASQPTLRRGLSGLMAFTKSERMRLRVTEDMAREIRVLAEAECRSLQDQIRFLISVGLEQRRRSVGKALEGEMRPLSARPVPRRRTA